MTWQAPTPGQATLVGHVNQFLTTHASQFFYDSGAAIVPVPTSVGAATALGSGMLAQTFTVATPVTSAYAVISLGAIGAGQDVLITLQADSGGNPSGIPLVGCVIPPEWMPSGIAVAVSTYLVPLPYALAAATYHIVVQPGSTLLAEFSQALAGVNDVQWTQTTGTGAQVYNGSWTNESYGFSFGLYANGGAQIGVIADDAMPDVSYPIPAKLSSFVYAATVGQLTSLFHWVTRSLGATMNLLCRDDASFESSIGSAVAVSNVTLTRSNAESLDGSYSLAMTATAVANMIAEVGPYPVVAGDVYSWTASFLGPAETAYVAVSWYDGATLISTTDGSSIVTSPTEWLASTGSFVAPATATVAYLQFVVDNAPASSVFYVDEVGLFAGSSATWSYPGVGVASLRSLHYTNGALENVQ